MTLNVNEETFKRAVNALNNQKVIAYPTEAVYGLGCDPRNEQAVDKILHLKKRHKDKGLILVAHDIEQLKPYIGTLTEKQWQTLQKSWPGPHTWLVPKSDQVPAWIHGAFDTVAVRVTDHPVAARLCQLFGHPIVSTSANEANQPPLKDNLAVFEMFANKIDYIVPGRVGSHEKPTPIQDLLTNKIIRN